MMRMRMPAAGTAALARLPRLPRLPRFSMPDPTLGQMIAFALITFFAWFFGVASAILPPLYLVAFFSMPLAILLAAAYPSLAMTGVLVISFGLLPPFIFASLPLGGATVRPPELILMMTFSILLIRGAGYWRSALQSARPLLIPFLVLGAGLAVALVQGRFIAHYFYAMADFRQYVGWLSLPVALWLTRRNPVAVHRVVMAIALIAAAAMAFQLLSGIQIIYGFRGAEELSKEFSDVKRSALGGGEFFLVYAAYYLFARLCDAPRGRFWHLLGFAIICVGLAASFSRAVWAGCAAGGLVFLLMTPAFRRGKIPHVFVMVMLAACMGGVVSMAVPRVAEAVITRIESVADEGGKGSSIGFRIDEGQQAWAAVKRSPIKGMGLGAEYKMVFRQNEIGGSFDSERSFVHNAYVGIWLKLGLAGIVFPFLLMWVLWRSCRRRGKCPPPEQDQARAVVLRSLAGFAAMVAICISGLTAPIWSTFVTVAAMSCLVALVYAPDMPTGKAEG